MREALEEFKKFKQFEKNRLFINFEKVGNFKTEIYKNTKHRC